MEPSDAEVAIIRETWRRWLRAQAELNRGIMNRKRGEALLRGDEATARAIEAALEPLVEEES
jgi:hypothetical protein